MRTKSRPAPQKPPADFAEVKRRFIRQNRELAKCNSSQSLQIRNLQLESARLLCENLELREQLLQLQNEVQRAKKKAASVDRLKVDLRLKLAEFSDLVDVVDTPQDDIESEDEREIRRLRMSMECQWRDRIPLTEAMRENQMPTIAEHKLFPRRTLGADENQFIRLSDQSSGDSPDIGPPPVAHFDYDDDVKHASPAGPASPKDGDGNSLPSNLCMNLEVRRKRKDTHPKLEIRRHSLLANSPVKPDGDPSAILRVGAKRKLADRDLEAPTINPPSQEEFTFSRRALPNAASETEAQKTSGKRVESRGEADIPAKPARKVLGDKSVNMSPQKTVPAKDPLKKHQDPKVKSDARSSARGRRLSSIPVPSPTHEPPQNFEVCLDDKSEARPVTPAAVDIFSPATSEPSTGANQNCDTPPPGELSNLSTLSMTSETGRHSRRARSAVNYAEPSLVAKMRRPGKEMADAVTGLQDPRRAMSASTDKKTGRSVAAQREQGDEDAWKRESTISNLPASAAIGSPLEQKSVAESAQISLLSAMAPKPVDPNVPSTSSTALSALIAESRKRRTSLERPYSGSGNDVAATTKKLAEMDLYDFKDSSSPNSENGKPATGPRSSRRHTLNNKDAATEIESKQNDEKLLAAAGLPRGDRAASRRRSMMV